MEPVPTWSPETVRGYLGGLDSCLQQYPLQEWEISGQELLDLSSQRLGQLGIRSIGHQEIILEAVEQLCALHYDLHSESLRSLTEKLWGVSQNLQSHILRHKKVLSQSSTSTISPTPQELVCIIDIVSATRSLFSWLNRYLFTRVNDYSASRDVIALCVELAETLHKDWSNPQVEERILSVCQNICGICENILSCSPHKLLSQTAILEPVQIQPEPPLYSLGIEIKSTSSGQHFICGTAPESPAGRCSGILAGDEIIQVNDQVVVGWARTNLVKKLREKTDCVTIILKKVFIIPSFGCSSLNKLHPAPTSRSTPTTPTEIEVPFSLIDQKPPSNQVKYRSPISDTSHSAPTTPTGHKDPVLQQIHSTPTTPSDNRPPLLAAHNEAPVDPEFLDPAVSSTNFSFFNNPSQNTEPWSQTPGFWTYPGSTSYRKSLFISVLPTSPISLPSPDPVTSPKSKTPPTSPTYEVKLISGNQPEPSLTSASQEKRISRPRTGSDSISSPTTSILSLPSSSGILRPALSDSSLYKSENPKIPNPPFLHKESRSPDSLILGQTSQPSRSPCSENKIQSQDTRNLRLRGKEGATRNQKGVITKLSRRRVSCKDLGSPDCDGWLWKRKENVSFMSQRWKRCWCVLKGERLYWYNAPQDEKALGMVNISSYRLESTMEPKKKYEFQLCHHTYKPFVFAADSLSDMSKWVTSLITSTNKHKASHSSANPREEECYSETEDEDQSRVQKMGEKQMIKPQIKTVIETETVSLQADQGATGVEMTSQTSSTTPEDDSLESLISCLKQGGVSLIGKKTVLTHDEYRKSFIRRNKNPEINRKAHTLRALQSTLKAKLLELEVLNQVLENQNLSSSIFQRWKSDHGQLYDSLGKGPKAKGYRRDLSPRQERKIDDNAGEQDDERREDSETSD